MLHFFVQRCSIRHLHFDRSIQCSSRKSKAALCPPKLGNAKSRAAAALRPTDTLTKISHERATAIVGPFSASPFPRRRRLPARRIAAAAFRRRGRRNEDPPVNRHSDRDADGAAGGAMLRRKAAPTGAAKSGRTGRGREKHAGGNENVNLPLHACCADRGEARWLLVAGCNETTGQYAKVSICTIPTYNMGYIFRT